MPQIARITLHQELLQKVQPVTAVTQRQEQLQVVQVLTGQVLLIQGAQAQEVHQEVTAHLLQLPEQVPKVTVRRQEVRITAVVQVVLHQFPGAVHHHTLPEVLVHHQVVVVPEVLQGEQE